VTAEAKQEPSDEGAAKRRALRVHPGDKTFRNLASIARPRRARRFRRPRLEPVRDLSELGSRV